MDDVNYIFFLFIYDNLVDDEFKLIKEKLVTSNLYKHVVPIPANIHTKQHLQHNNKNITIKRFPCILQCQRDSALKIYYSENIDEVLNVISNLGPL